MDSATRQTLQNLRAMLMAEVQRLDVEKRARIQQVTSRQDFDPFTHSMDSGVAKLIADQNALIRQLQEIDRQLEE